MVLGMAGGLCLSPLLLPAWHHLMSGGIAVITGPLASAEMN